MTISLKNVAAVWMKSPKFKAGYHALEAEFELASSKIRTTIRVNLDKLEAEKKK